MADAIPCDECCRSCGAPADKPERCSYCLTPRRPGRISAGAAPLRLEVLYGVACLRPQMAALLSINEARAFLRGSA